MTKRPSPLEVCILAILYGLHVLLTLLLLLLSPQDKGSSSDTQDSADECLGDSGMGFEDPCPMPRPAPSSIPSLYRSHGQYSPPPQSLRSRLAHFLHSLQSRPSSTPSSTWSMTLLHWAWKWTGDQAQALGGNLGFVRGPLSPLPQEGPEVPKHQGHGDQIPSPLLPPREKVILPQQPPVPEDPPIPILAYASPGSSPPPSPSLLPREKAIPMIHSPPSPSPHHLSSPFQSSSLFAVKVTT
ncbi:MAG: hypothetical protein DHS80DRAFT_28341 [Piptocephalis tieghemiana]|nr:MAG: hypothetical protein DHS80DRAFT_28341 [Piptocephalis tieghemiana]